MRSPIRPTGSLGDELTNAALAGLAVLGMTAVLLRVAGNVAAFLTGAAQPKAGLGAGAAVLLHPGDPAVALEVPGLNVIVVFSFCRRMKL